jgi:hypothetical protein
VERVQAPGLSPLVVAGLVSATSFPAEGAVWEICGKPLSICRLTSGVMGSGDGENMGTCGHHMADLVAMSCLSTALATQAQRRGL